MNKSKNLVDSRMRNLIHQLASWAPAWITDDCVCEELKELFKEVIKIDREYAQTKSKNLVDLSHLPCPEGHHLEVRTVKTKDRILRPDGRVIVSGHDYNNDLRVIAVPDKPSGKWVDVKIDQWEMCGKKARFRDSEDDEWGAGQNDTLCGFRGTNFLGPSMPWNYAQVWVESE